MTFCPSDSYTMRLWAAVSTGAALQGPEWWGAAHTPNPGPGIWGESWGPGVGAGAGREALGPGGTACPSPLQHPPWLPRPLACGPGSVASLLPGRVDPSSLGWGSGRAKEKQELAGEWTRGQGAAGRVAGMWRGEPGSPSQPSRGRSQLAPGWGSRGGGCRKLEAARRALFLDTRLWGWG